VSFFSAKDIPGKNAVDIHSLKLFVEVGAEVECVGAPVGVILATTDALANQAAALVKLTYADIGKTPITNIAQAISENSFYKFPSVVVRTLLTIKCHLLFYLFILTV
jgi:xanthine dehydrogenase/oxidase